MRLGNRISLVMGLTLIFQTSLSFASFEDELQTQIFQYAADNSPVFYLSNKTYFTTGNFLTRIDAYFESSAKGAWSLDPDPARFDFKLNEKGNSFVWLGREQPLNLVRGQPVEFTSALGSVWVQNQIDALNPHVSGWVGAGLVEALDSKSSWKLVLAYSPLFLPTFGPSLGFTDRGDLNPSRFARLPPAQVITGGVTVPIRYRLRLDQLSDLVLQHQAFVGVSHDDSHFNMDVYAYTAPKPDPVPLTDARLAVGGNSVNAAVDVDPQFPREYWSGFRVQNKDLVFQPAFEYVQKLNQLAVHVVSLTGYFDSPQLNPFALKRNTRASFGIVTHFEQMFDAPTQSDGMVFVKLPFDLSNDLVWRTMLQATLLNARRSFYWLNELEYTVRQGFSIVGAVRILSGDDSSYFGDWRDQDSYSAGVKWIW